MKTFIFIFYYINISGMTSASAETVINSIVKRTDLSNCNTNELKIIQQYFPIMEGETRVELHHIPNKVVVSSEKETDKTNRSISILNENIKNMMPIQNINELYE